MRENRTTEETESKAQRRGRLRAVKLRTSQARMKRRADGAFIIEPEEPLGHYPRVLTERLTHWARVAPDRAFVAKRGADGAWRYVSYAEALRKVRSLGQALLDRGLSAERPVAILSDNDIEHLLLMLAGIHVGVPTASVAPAYSLLSKDFAKLRHVMRILTPGMVFTASAAQYRRAIQATVGRDVEVVSTEGAGESGNESRGATLFDELATTVPTETVDRAHAAIQADDVAKFLFSSGSTGVPKAVINTHRMICSNQQMILQGFCFLGDEPPVLVDWLPWNHTAGGNHNTGMTLYNGGTLYIDDGRPAGKIEVTVENLREIAPTVYFNVPRGYEELLAHFRKDRQLRDKFFSRLKFMFYAGAGMSQALWDEYRKFMTEECLERVMMASGLGATETSPMALQCTWDSELTGAIGIPMPGVEMKLAPVGTKLEARVKGPNVTPGYWRDPELSSRAFDEEGYYKFGDAVKLIDPEDVNKGMTFDGRLAEDFKLSSGTWVSVGPLRNRILDAFAPYVTDVVIAGLDRDEIGVLLLPNLEACRSLAPELGAGLGATASEILGHAAVRAKFATLLAALARGATGNSNRVTRAVLLEEPPAIDAGEITDKGSLNQKIMLERRAALVEEMYAENPSARVLRA
jgi:feruloyl-CoA synthase